MNDELDTHRAAPPEPVSHGYHYWQESCYMVAVYDPTEPRMVTALGSYGVRLDVCATCGVLRIRPVEPEKETQ